MGPAAPRGSLWPSRTTGCTCSTDCGRNGGEVRMGRARQGPGYHDSALNQGQGRSLRNNKNPTISCRICCKSTAVGALVVSTHCIVFFCSRSVADENQIVQIDHAVTLVAGMWQRQGAAMRGQPFQGRNSRPPSPPPPWQCRTPALCGPSMTFGAAHFIDGEWCVGPDAAQVMKQCCLLWGPQPVTQGKFAPSDSPPPSPDPLRVACIVGEQG